MSNEDCEEYYQQRVDEISDWMEHGLESAAVRNKLFVRLLRVKIERKTRRDDRTAQILCDAVAKMRYELETCRDRAAAAASRVEDQLGRYVDGVRANAAAGEGEIAVVAKLTAQNRRLGEVVKLRRERLENVLADIRTIQSQIDAGRCENDRIKVLCTVATKS